MYVTRKCRAILSDDSTILEGQVRPDYQELAVLTSSTRFERMNGPERPFAMLQHLL